MTKEFLICFLDVLGFESLVSTKPVDEIVGLYEQLIRAASERAGGPVLIHAPPGMAMAFTEVEFTYFSDSLLFWTPLLDGGAVGDFLDRMLELMCVALEQRVPLRGAISCGNALMNKSSGTFIGVPLVTCARAEKIQNWLGICLTLPFGPGSGPGFFMHQILPYRSCYKDPTNQLAVGAALDWPRHWRESRSGSVLPILMSLRDAATDKEKYDATIKFVGWSEHKHDWFKRGEPVVFG